MLQSKNPGPCVGFDEYAGKRWIYPNNMPIRNYQKTAVEMALFNNVMIVLPTGFGKTFIAAVVMYNFYRWYPQGKIIFVAPTRPLVTQQIQECRKISGIPSRDCVELTGLIGTDKRRVFWEQRRVFFATPQVIENDLTSGLLPAQFVRCIVIDEAHRAQGNYAYVNIVRHLQENNRNGFRVLALSATPGSDIQKVQQVMLNLYISEVMFRSETSIDLMQYRNEKSSKAWTVELVGKHKEFVNKYIDITNPIFKELYRAGLTYSGDSIERVAKYTLVKAMQAANINEVARNGSTRGRLKFLCGAALSLSHNFELLTLYGIRVFYSSIMRNLAETRSAIKTALAGKVEFDVMIGDIERIFGEDVEPNPSKVPKVDLLQGHPKLTVVKDLLMRHFQENEGKSETRAIVFTKFRESVYDIVQTMKAYEPLIKPAAFVGQGTGSKSGASSKTGPGMTQREQIELVNNFKEGVYNVIIATCVAEEGLDIGEVDLIICYDTSSSPISTTQRRGRTGRKRSGNVQTILTKGYEEKRLQKAGASRRQVEDQLFKKENYTPYKYRDAPRMVPQNIVPICLEQKIFPIDDGDDQEEAKPKRKRRKKNTDESMEEDNSFTPKKQKKKQISPINKSFEEDWDSDEDLFTPSARQVKTNNNDNSVHQSRDEVFDKDGLGTPRIQLHNDNNVHSTPSEQELTQSQPSSSHYCVNDDDDDLEWDDDFDVPPLPEQIEE